MPAPLPPDQLTIIRTLLSKGDNAGAIKVYMEATGATQAEAKTEVTNLASRYGLIGSQLPDLFVRRTPAKPAPPAPAAPAPEPAAPAAPSAPPAPAPVAQQAANVPLEPTPAPAPAAPVPPPPPAPAPVAPLPKAVPAPAAPVQAAAPVSVPKPQASPVSTPQPAPVASTPSTKKSRWGCSSAIVLLGGIAGVAWWVLA